MEWTIYFATECTGSNPREKSTPCLLLERWLVCEAARLMGGS